MYKKSVQGWLKHLDFMILDVVCLWISFTLAFNTRKCQVFLQHFFKKNF